MHLLTNKFFSIEHGMALGNGLAYTWIQGNTKQPSRLRVTDLTNNLDDNV